MTMQPQPQKSVTVIKPSDFNMTKDQMQLVIDTVAKGATVNELKLFLYTAQRVGLDPLTRQIYFIKRKQKQADGTYKEIGTTQTGIDGYRAIAERTGKLAGIDDAVFDTETEDHPNKASVTVHKMVEGQKMSFTASARWDEYVQTFKDGKPMNLWARMPYLMLGKCAEALALRKAFPNDLSGLYTAEEMSQADGQAPVAPPIKVDVEIVDNGNDQAPPSQPVGKKNTAIKTAGLKNTGKTIELDKNGEPKETDEADNGEITDDDIADIDKPKGNRYIDEMEKRGLISKGMPEGKGK